MANFHIFTGPHTGWVCWWEVAKTKPGSGLSIGAKKLRMPDSALSCSIWSEYRACRPSWLLAAHALPSRKKYHRNRCKHMQTLSKLTKNTCWTVPSLIWQSQVKNSLFTSLVLWRKFNMHIWPSPFTHHGNLRATSNAIPSGIIRNKGLIKRFWNPPLSLTYALKIWPLFQGPPPVAWETVGPKAISWDVGGWVPCYVVTIP